MAGKRVAEGRLEADGGDAPRVTADRVRPAVPGERRTTVMADVAKLAGVSAMTVSRALRNPGDVTAETLKRIDAAIKQTGYLRNRIAGSLASKRSNVVGLVVPSLRYTLLTETIQGVADTLGQKFDLMIANSGYELKGEEAAVVAFLSQRVCGIVLHNTTHTARTRRLLKEAGVPIVETGMLVASPLDMAVGFSSFAAGEAMTDYLIGRGYRRIAFVTLPLRDNDRMSERQAGHLAALAKHRLKIDPDLILHVPPGLRNGALALARLMEGGHRPDAIFLTGDVLATGAILEACRQGWKVPEQIAIAGSDDSELQENVVPPVTTIRFPRYEIGRRAAGMLLDRIEGRASGPGTLDLGFEIVSRQSA